MLYLLFSSLARRQSQFYKLPNYFTLMFHFFKRTAIVTELAQICEASNGVKLICEILFFDHFQIQGIFSS